MRSRLTLVQNIPCGNDTMGRVYSADGISPTVLTWTHGGGGTITVCITEEGE